MTTIPNPPETVNSQGYFASAPSSITWGGTHSLGSSNNPGFKSFCCIDTLHIGLNVEWEREDLLDVLHEAKQSCQDDDFKNHPIELFGYNDLVMYPSGKKGGYGYHISTGDIHIFFSRHDPRGSTPNVFIEIGSLSCWNRGVFDVLNSIRTMFAIQGGRIIKTSINRVDMACDFVGLDIHETQIFDREKWIMMARKYRIYGESRRDNTAAFGFASRSVISLRVYDKLLELRDDPAKLLFFKAIWDFAPDEELPVTRVEFQLRKDFLKSMDSQDFNDFTKNMQGIWKYLTEDWFRLAKKVDRNHTQNAENTEWWDIVTNVKWTDEIVFLERTTKKPNKIIEPLIDQAAGIAISVCAYMDMYAEDINGIVKAFNERIKSKLEDMFNNTHSEFVKKFVVRQSCCWDSLYQSLIPGL